MKNENFEKLFSTWSPERRRRYIDLLNAIIEMTPEQRQAFMVAMRQIRAASGESGASRQMAARLLGVQLTDFSPN